MALYNYLKAIDKKVIEPTQKEHKAMLFLLHNEVGALLASPLLKQKQLAYLLHTTESFLSTNKEALQVDTDWDSHLIYLQENNEALLEYLYQEADAMNSTNLTMVDGILLYNRKDKNDY